MKKIFMAILGHIARLLGLSNQYYDQQPSVEHIDLTAGPAAYKRSYKTDGQLMFRGLFAQEDLLPDLEDLVGYNGLEGVYGSPEDGVYYLSYVLQPDLTHLAQKRLFFNEICRRHNARLGYADKVSFFAPRCDINELKKIY